MNTNIEEQLTADEKELFDILQSMLSVVAPDTTLRVAGGWVRDKLLGKFADDIDFMVDNMSGARMGKLIANFMGLQDPNVVKENPDASKNLESATMMVPVSSGKKFELDFTEARKEVYSDDSRVPEIQSATPEEDAFRRDLTLNSLFYNLRTKEVEDFTGRGIQDLQNMYLKTPLEPLETFNNDPLRILRTIRFAARYGAEIDPETRKALSDPSLQTSIMNKLKPERLAQEVQKMMKGPNPTMALELLNEVGMMRNIVDNALKGTKFEGQMSQFDMDQNNPHHDLTVWDHTMKVIGNVLDIYQDSDEEKRVIMLLSALLHDFGKMFLPGHVQREDRTSYPKHHLDSAEIAEHLLRYLNYSESKYVKPVRAITRYHMRPHDLERGGKITPRALSNFISDVGSEGILWIDVLNHAIADAKSKGEKVDPTIDDRYNKVRAQLEEMVIALDMKANEVVIKPVLNGNEIMEALGQTKGGAYMREVTEFVKRLKLDDPLKKISTEDAKALVRSQFPQYVVPQPDPPIDFADQTKEASSCPKHLLSSEITAIQQAIEEKNAVKAMSLIRNLKEGFEEDDVVSEEIANAMFDILLIDRTQKDIDVLGHLFELAMGSFFNTNLCVPVLGILLLIETGTEEEVIERIFERMHNMDHESLMHMLQKLPKSSHRAELVKRLLADYE